MALSWKIGRIAGIDVYLHPTLLLLLAFAAVSEGGLVVALLIAAMFGCVLLHELGHAFAARGYGIQTADITLYPIGGVARLARMPRKPGPEIVVALAGPAVNVVIAAILTVAVLVIGSLSVAPGSIMTTGAEFLVQLLFLNLLLAGFNLVPAFPMDGGRVLRAFLSSWLGRLRATEIAAGIGRTIALLFGLWSLWNGPFLHAILAAFIYIAAGMERARVRIEERGRGGPFADDPTLPPEGYRWVRVGKDVWHLAPIAAYSHSDYFRAKNRTWL